MRGGFTRDAIRHAASHLLAARTELKLSAAGSGISTSVTSATINPAFGIGARYDFTNTFCIRTQYEDFGKVGDANTTGSYKATLISAGIIFKL
jgi:hypothetical protein